MTDIILLGETMRVDALGAYSEGYIRDAIISYPNKIVFHLYSRIKLDALSELGKDRFLLWHLDATRSMLKKTKGIHSAKPFYYYALVGTNGHVTIPLAEMLSSDHTSPTIQFWLMRYIYMI